MRLFAYAFGWGMLGGLAVASSSQLVRAIAVVGIFLTFAGVELARAPRP